MDGINDLQNGTDRHAALAGFIFSQPLAQCGKNTVFRFLGKKTRHAGNYGQQGATMAAGIIKEGIFELASGAKINKELCDFLLGKFHEKEPFIQHAFWKYVEQTLTRTRILVTPFGRRRVFFGLRPQTNNADIFRDAYSYIPQSTVGDNTGLAILYLEARRPGLVVSDSHDAVTLEVDDSYAAIADSVALLTAAFDRVITFENGFTLKIPIEIELGHNLGEMITCVDSSEAGLRSAYDMLKRPSSPITNPQITLSSGAQQQQLAQA
jgi:hypothetical protein